MDATYEMFDDLLSHLWLASWQAAVLVLLVLLLQRLFRNQLSARFRYLLWFVVFARLAMPIAPQSELSVFRLASLIRMEPDFSTPVSVPAGESGMRVTTLEQPPKRLPVEWPDATGILSPDSIELSAHADLEEYPIDPFAATARNTVQTDADDAPSHALPAVNSAGQSTHDRTPALPVAPLAARQSSTDSESSSRRISRADSALLLSRYFLALVWLFGIGVLSVRVARAQRQLNRRLANLVESNDGRVRQILEHCQRRMRVTTAVRVLVTPDDVSPAAVGWWRPRLVISQRVLDDFSEQDLRFVFMHELAHIRRQDIAVNWLVISLRTLHWFNPLIWLASRRLQDDRELACDALVLSQLPQGENRAYGRTLLKMVENLVTPRWQVGATGMVETKRSLTQRIGRIAQFRSQSFAQFVWGVALLIAISWIGLTSPVRTTAAIEPQQATAAQVEPEIPPTGTPSRTPIDGAVVDGSTNSATSTRTSETAAGFVSEPTEYATHPIRWGGDQIANVMSVALSPDGRFLAASYGVRNGPGGLGAVVVWDVNTRQVQFDLKYPRGVFDVKYSPDGTRIAIGVGNKRAQLLDAATGDVLDEFMVGNNTVTTVSFSPNGQLLATGMNGGYLRQWDLATGSSSARRKRHHAGQVKSLVYSPDSQKLFSCGGTGELIKVWKAGTHDYLDGLELNGVMAECLALAPDGSTLAAGCNDGTIKLWNVDTGKLMKELLHSRGNGESSVVDVDFISGGRTLVSGGQDGRVKLWNVKTGVVTHTVSVHEGGVTGIAVAADGSHFATTGADRRIRVRTAPVGPVNVFTRQPTFRTQEAVLSAAWSPGGSLIATAQEDGIIRVHDARTAALKLSLAGHQDIVSALAFSPDRATLASSSYDNTVKLWKVDRQTISKEQTAPIQDSLERHTLRGHTKWVMCLGYSRDGKWLVSGSYDKTVRIWNAESGAPIAVLEGHQAAVRAVAISPDGKLIASAGSDRTVKLWEMATRREVATLKGHDGAVRAIQFSPDGTSLATAGEDAVIQLWDVSAVRNSANAQPRATLTGHDDMVWCLAFSPGGTTLASGGFDRQVKLWDPQHGSLRATMTGHADVVSAIAFAPDSSAFVSTGHDKRINWWPAKIPAPVKVGPLTSLRIENAGNRPQSAGGQVAISSAGYLWATASQANGIQIRSLKTGDVIRTLAGTNAEIKHVVFSRDGQLVAAASSDGQVKIWNPQNGELLFRLIGHEAGVRRVAFSSDSRLLASAGWDRTARLWDVQSGKLLHTSPKQSLPVTDVAFSPDGKVLATSFGSARGSPGEVKLWDVATGDDIARLGSHTTGIEGLEFSPGGKLLYCYGSEGVYAWQVSTRSLVGSFADGSTITYALLLGDGQRMAVAGRGGKITIWNTLQRRPVLELEGHSADVTSLAASADHSVIASVTVGGQLFLWPTERDRRVREFATSSIRVWNVAFSPDGRQLATTGEPNKATRLRSVQSGAVARSLEGHTQSTQDVAFSADGTRLVTGGFDRTARLWDAASGKELRRFEGSLDRLYRVNISPDGKLVASGGPDETVRLWDADTGEMIREIRPGGGRVKALAFSPDGKTLLSGCYNNCQLYDVESGSVLQQFDGFDGLFHDAKFDVTGSKIISATNDVNIWDIKTGEELSRWRVPGVDYVARIAVVPGGDYVVTGDTDGQILVWELASGQVIHRLEGHTGRIIGLAVSPQGNFMASSGFNKKVRLWRFPPFQNDTSRLAGVVRNWAQSANRIGGSP